MVTPKPSQAVRAGEVSHRLSSALQKDLEKRLGTEDIFAWIESQAEELATLGRCASGWVRLTRDIFRARHIEEVKPGKVLGKANIFRGKTGYLVEFARGLPDEVRRFAIAHEIGHTYWFDGSAPGVSVTPLTWKGGRDPNIEYLCNRFAAALLLPRNSTRHWFLREGPAAPEAVPPLHMLRSAAQHFRVPEQAVAKRFFFEISCSQLAIISLRRAVSDDVQKTKTWVVAWCVLPDFIDRSRDADGVQIPIKQAGRVVPSAWIPDLPGEGTVEVDLDARWWRALNPVGNREGKTPLRRWEEKGSLRGYASSTLEGRTYIAIPADSESWRRAARLSLARWAAPTSTQSDGERSSR